MPRNRSNNGSPQHLSKDMAPYRKTLMILRPSGEIKYEREWEKWDTLSNRQLIRPAHPCRLNVTVFARDSQPSETEAAQPSQVHPSSSDEPMALDSSSSKAHAEPLSESPGDAAPAPRDGEIRRISPTNPASEPIGNLPKESEIQRHEQGLEFQSLPNGNRTNCC